MTAQASRQLAQDQGFQDQVRVAALEAAIAVAAEPAETANHQRRAELATRVLMSPQRWAEIMAEAVAVNPTIAGRAVAGEAIPQGEIEYAVVSLWDAYAGAGGGDG